MDSRYIPGTPRLRLAGRLRSIQHRVSGIDHTVAYIRGQEVHHRKRSFREEVETFLKKHGMAYEKEMLH